MPIYYESRLARLALPEAERPRLDEAFEEVIEGQEAERKELEITAIPGLPIPIQVSGALPHDPQLIDPRLDAHFVADKPKRLIRDRAYGSDRLDAALTRFSDLPARRGFN